MHGVHDKSLLITKSPIYFYGCTVNIHHMCRDWRSCFCSAALSPSTTNWMYIRIPAADCRKHG